MRFTKLLYRSMFALIALTAALPACGNTSEGITAETIQDNEGSITEQHDAATVVWSVDGDGNVKALVKTPDGKPVNKNVYGTLTVSGVDPAFVPMTMPIAPDPKTGVLSAVIPMPDDEITVVKYDLKVDGKPVVGAMHLPHGGTAELVANAKLAEAKKLPEGKKGPNGGVVQVVGDDVVEIVADKSNGNVRVYVLDADLKPVKIGERKITIGFVGPKGPDTIVLAPDSGGAYFVGKMNVVVNPTKLTVVVADHDDVHVVLCGYRPRGVILVGASAPSHLVLVNVNWGGVVVVNPTPVIVVGDRVHWHGKGKGKGRWGGKKGGGGIHINIH